MEGDASPNARPIYHDHSQQRVDQDPEGGDNGGLEERL